jgi:hypothetical protein
MKPITYYVQTPAIDALVNEYGDRLEVMSPSDRFSFLQIVVKTLANSLEFMPEPDGTDNAIQAWYFIYRESEATLTALVAAVATIQMENGVSDRVGQTQPPSGAQF